MAETPVTNPIILSSDDEDEQNPPENNYQIVLYNPPDPDPLQPDPIQSIPPNPNPPPQPQPSKVLPSVGTFTVQCSNCYKWRLIPSKEKYEEIREHILDRPFTCDVAKEWRVEISCEVEGDIEQEDDGRLWAIDKPNIAQPPPGWERELRIRGEGCSKFADVYYISPAGKRLRSMVEIQRYLLEHPEFVTEGLTLSQFSFRIPKPMREDYVRKRSASKPLQTIAANPISWIAPDDATSLQIVQPDYPADFVTPRKKARPSTDHNNSDLLHHSPKNFKIRGPQIPPNGLYDL